MYRNIDVKTEMRKLASSKPVHAAAGAGVLASQTISDLPGRLVRWGTDHPVTSLPSRATGYVQTARAKAADSYDMLAARGKKAMNGRSHGTQTKSAQSAQSKGALDGKPKGKAPSRTGTGTGTGH
jgi:hypothetical protein